MHRTDELTLPKKINNSAQPDSCNFCFSNDGKWLAGFSRFQQTGNLGKEGILKMHSFQLVIRVIFTLKYLLLGKRVYQRNLSVRKTLRPPTDGKLNQALGRFWGEIFHSKEVILPN